MNTYKNILLMVLFVLLGSCASGTYFSHIEREEAVEPVTIEKETESFAFYKIIFSLEEDQTIGYHYGGILKAKRNEYFWKSSQKLESYYYTEIVQNELRDYGYNVIQENEGMFDSTSHKARYHIGATINNFQFNTFKSFGVHTAEMAMDVKWEVYDSKADKVVYSQETQSQAYVDISGKEPSATFKQLFQNCLKKGVRKFLAQNEWLVAFKDLNKEPESTHYDDILNIEIADTEKSYSMPSDIEELFPSVVVVSTGDSHGSGVIISQDGYILTAAHVVDDKETVSVSFQSGIEFEGQVVRINAVKDLALIKVPGKKHPFISFASEKSGIGKDIYAIGSPLSTELSYSVTKGIISGYRNYEENEYIQTDAKLNPGNSGGPLLNHKGEIIGIVSWKIVLDGYEGLAFGVCLDDIEEDLFIDLDKE